MKNRPRKNHLGWMIAVLLVPCALHAETSPSVLIQTEMPRQGTRPDIVTAYGTAVAASNGIATLITRQDGNVAAIFVTPGEAVEAGQILIDIAQSPAAESAYRQASSLLTAAQSARAQTNRLLKQQLATRDQLAQADKGVMDARSALDALRREGGERTIQRIIAPFAGIVQTIPVSVGAWVSNGASLATIMRHDGLVVTVGIEPRERGKVHPGETAQIFSLDMQGSVTGRVLRIDQALNPTTRLIDADIAIPPGAAMSGGSYRADIVTGQLQGWIVPHDAVLADAQGAYVFQVNADKAVRVTVNRLGSAQVRDIVAGSLDPTKPIVVQGNYQLDDGMAVRQGDAQESGL